MTEEVWTIHNESVVERVTDRICKLPAVPRVLKRSQPMGPEVSSDRSIHHYLRGMVSALSENPDTVDAILDITEDIKKELVALQKLEMEITQPDSPAETTQNVRADPLCTDNLLNLTSLFEAGLIDWDIEKDELLGSMQAQLASLNLEHQDTARKRFNMAVARNLEEIATSLGHMQRTNLAALNKTLQLLLDDIPTTIQCLDAFEDGIARDTSTAPNRPSVLKRLLLWSLPFTSTLPNIFTTSLTLAERKQIVHDKSLDIRPLLYAIEVSNRKALSATTTAETLMMMRTSWIGSMLEVFRRGNQDKFDKNLLAGLKNMRSLVPMIMEQRKGGRADRKYMRTMARARKAV